MTGGPGALSAPASASVLGVGVSAVDLGRGMGLCAPRLMSTLVELEERGHVQRLSGEPGGSGGLPRYRIPLHASGGAAAWTRPRRIPDWVVAAGQPPWLAALVVLLVGAVTVAVSGGSMPVDLEVYRRGGSSVLHETPIYDQPSGWLPFTYPPLAALAFTGLAVIPAQVAIGVAATGSCVALYVIVRVTLEHLRMNVAWAPALVLAAALLEPVSATLGFGQVNLVLAAVIMVDLLRPSRRWSGVLLGLAICIKVTPAIFLLLLLRRRDRPMLRRTLVTAASGTLLPALLVPRSWAEFWFHALWDPHRVGGLAYAGNQSLTGAIWRLTGPDEAPTFTYLMSAAAPALLLMCLRRRDADPLTAILACAFTGLLISPISWSHHWVWILPLMLWAVRPSAPHRRARAVLAGAWVVAALTRVIWLGPHGGDLEYLASPPLVIATDAYALLGAATLALLLIELRAQHGRQDPQQSTPTPSP